jgi:hypothetical protein
VDENRERDRTQADESRMSSACAEGRPTVRLPFVTTVAAERAEGEVLDKATTSRQCFSHLDG